MTRKEIQIIFASFGLGVAAFLYGSLRQLLLHDLWHCPAPLSPWRFERVDDFKNDIARVTITDKGHSRSGYIHREGRVVIPLQYAEIGAFFEGLVAAQDAESRKWGFLDREGRTVIPFVYDRVQQGFDDGVTIVTQNKNDFLINRRGEIISERYEFLYPYDKHGFIYAKHQGQNHFLDLRGKPLQGEALIAAQNAWAAEKARVRMSAEEREAANFALMWRVLSERHREDPLQSAYRQGVALKQERKGADWYLIDAQGERMAGPYVSVSMVEENGVYYPFSESTPRIVVRQRRNNDWRTGLIDAKGEVIVPFGRYDAIGGFHEGYAIVADTTSTVSDRLPETTYTSYGFIDGEGREVIALRYRHARPFSQGWAAVQFGNAWRFIDHKGCAMPKPKDG